MSALSQPIVSGDWLKFEEDNRFCREDVTVIAAADLPSGQVLGTESTWTTRYVKYDNSNAAAAGAILIEGITVNPALTPTSIVSLNNVGTATFADPHGLAVGDVIGVTGATVDTDLNSHALVATVPTEKTFTFVTASVSNNTYTEATLRVTKLNHQASVIVRGPALVNFNQVNWGSSDSTGITAGLADLKALGIVSQEGE
jgi:hypothetical protein